MSVTRATRVINEIVSLVESSNPSILPPRKNVRTLTLAESDECFEIAWRLFMNKLDLSGKREYERAYGTLYKTQEGSG